MYYIHCVSELSLSINKNPPADTAWYYPSILSAFPDNELMVYVQSEDGRISAHWSTESELIVSDTCYYTVPTLIAHAISLVNFLFQALPNQPTLYSSDQLTLLQLVFWVHKYDTYYWMCVLLQSILSYIFTLPCYIHVHVDWCFIGYSCSCVPLLSGCSCVVLLPCCHGTHLTHLYQVLNSTPCE